MRKFAETYSEITQQLAAKLPWGHVIVLIEQIKDKEACEWYVINALKNGIAHSVLKMQ